MTITNENSLLTDREDPPDEEMQDMDRIDLQALAEEIFRLLKYELLIENERQGR